MGATDLWRAYRDAYRQFEYAAGLLAKIHNPVDAEAALLSVEQARLAYNDTRDALAVSLMPAELRQLFFTIPAAAWQENRRVKGIAELFWEMAGKPQGSAEDDWYRAERVVRHAVDVTQTSVCALS